MWKSITEDLTYSNAPLSDARRGTHHTQAHKANGTFETPKEACDAYDVVARREGLIISARPVSSFDRAINPRGSPRADTPTTVLEALHTLLAGVCVGIYYWTGSARFPTPVEETSTPQAGVFYYGEEQFHYVYKSDGKFRTQLQVNGIHIDGPVVACPKVCSARSQC